MALSGGWRMRVSLAGGLHATFGRIHQPPRPEIGNVLGVLFDVANDDLFFGIGNADNFIFLTVLF